MQHGPAFWYYGVHEGKRFGDLHERAGRGERIIHCRPTNEIDPLAIVVFEELATQIAGALAKPIRGSGRNLHELVPIHPRLEPIDDDFELSVHLPLHLLSSRLGPECPVSAESEAKRRVNPMSASRSSRELPPEGALVAPSVRPPLPPFPNRGAKARSH